MEGGERMENQAYHLTEKIIHKVVKYILNNKLLMYTSLKSLLVPFHISNFVIKTNTSY